MPSIVPAATATPSARQLLLRLLLAVDGGVLDAAAAIRAGAVFGISANTIRVALNRLLRTGHIDMAGRGSYRMGRSSRALGNDIAAWRDVEQRLCPWQGSWVGVSVCGLPRTDRRANRTRARAFALLGMRALDEAIFIRPDNLLGGIPHARARLRSLGLEPAAAVFSISALDAATEARAHRLWKRSELERGYRHGKKTLDASLIRLPRLPLQEAARESYLIGDRALRSLVFDPLLPEPLLSAEERRAFVDAMLRYDAAGQRIWRTLLTLPI